MSTAGGWREEFCLYLARIRTAATGAVHQRIESEQFAVHHAVAGRNLLWTDAHSTGFASCFALVRYGHHKQVSKISDLSVR